MKKPNLKKVTGKSVVQRALIPVGCALLGGIAGSALGGPWNLVGAAATAAAGIATENQNLVFAASGMAVVTPTKTATVAGLDGLPEIVSAGKNRAFSYVKGKLSNAKLDFIADKIPVSGLSGLDEVGDAYETGYQDGVNQAVGELMDGDDEMAGSPYSYGADKYLSAGSSATISPDAMKLRQMLATA